VWGALGLILNAGYLLWLYQRMFLGEAENESNRNLTDLTRREWAYLLPLIILSLWIGIYPRTFTDYLTKSVACVVQQVRPTYSTAARSSAPE
jgi:NADH-quinone oxidoreductase subunit M